THAGAGLDVDDTDPGFGGQLGAVDAQRAVVLERPVRLRRVGVATGPVAPCNVRLQGEAEAAHVAAHAGLYAHGPRVVVVWIRVAQQRAAAIRKPGDRTHPLHPRGGRLAERPAAIRPARTRAGLSACAERERGRRIQLEADA